MDTELKTVWRSLTKGRLNRCVPCSVATFPGLALVPAAEAAGLTLFHSGAKRILQNEHYLGDDFYPAIIDSETFSKVAEERNRRAGALGRTRERTTPPPCEAETAFIIGKVTHRYDDPFKQAAYIYSLIESEVRNG